MSKRQKCVCSAQFRKKHIRSKLEKLHQNDLRQCKQYRSKNGEDICYFRDPARCSNINKCTVKHHRNPAKCPKHKYLRDYQVSWLCADKEWPIPKQMGLAHQCVYKDTRTLQAQKKEYLQKRGKRHTKPSIPPKCLNHNHESQRSSKWNNANKKCHKKILDGVCRASDEGKWTVQKVNDKRKASKNGISILHTCVHQNPPDNIPCFSIL